MNETRVPARHTVSLTDGIRLKFWFGDLMKTCKKSHLSFSLSCRPPRSQPSTRRRCRPDHPPWRRALPVCRLGTLPCCDSGQRPSPAALRGDKTHQRGRGSQRGCCDVATLVSVYLGWLFPRRSLSGRDNTGLLEEIEEAEWWRDQGGGGVIGLPLWKAGRSQLLLLGSSFTHKSLLIIRHLMSPFPALSLFRLVSNKQ